MTNLIVNDAQQLEISSPIIDLYELQIGIGTNNTLFFHSAKDLDNDTSSNDLILCRERSYSNIWSLNIVSVANFLKYLFLSAIISP